jgi:DNA-binding NtrC family response regulator
MAKTMDPKLVAAKQKEEVQYIHKTYQVPFKVVKKVAGEVGASRKKIYTKLKELGYDMVIPNNA